MVFLFQVTVRKPSMELPSLTVERLLQANDLIGAEKSIDEFYSKIRDGYRLAHTNPGEIKKKDPELYRQYQKDMSELDKCNSKLNDFERKNPVLYKELLLKGIGSEDVGTSNIATNLAMDRLPGELEHGKELTFGRWGAADAREVASKIYACRENGGVAGAWDGMAAGIVSNILLALDGHYNMNSWPLPKEKPEDLLEKGDVKDLLAIMSARKFGNVSERIFVETMKVALKDDDPYVRMNAYALMDGAFGEYILYQNTRNNGWYEKHFSKKATLELSKLIIENEEDMKKEKGTRPWELVMYWRDVLKGA